MDPDNRLLNGAEKIVGLENVFEAFAFSTLFRCDSRNFDRDILRQARYLNSGPGWRVGAEVSAIHLVHGSEVVEVAEIDRRADHIGHRHAIGRQHCR